ncbi:MAG TPA: outer membrane protein assembly factor BamA [Anaeromyxobacteraceae bacterium]|nr:outer membrane protein assembly factor BamA [Anaeromyxobacteraceae bacterium]
MRRPLHSALAVLLVAAAPLALAEDEPVVKGIEVEGNRRVEVDAIKAALSTRPGDPLDPARIRNDVRAVMKLGYFADVSIEARGPTAAPTLVVKVKEKPSVQGTRIEGAEEFSADDLKDAIEVKQYQVLDATAVRRSVKKIQEKYVEKGYYLAEVTSRLEEKPDNQVVVVFVVNEHAKVQVRQVSILGNARLAREEILPFLQTQEGGFLDFITSGGTYKEEAIQRDVQAMQAVYLEHGYVNVKVGRPSVSLTPDKRYLYVTIPVEEGEQFNIGKIDFSGELLDLKGALRGLVKIRPGELFMRSKVGADLFAVGDVYKDLGYAYVNVTPLTNVDPKARTIDLTFDVQPGQKVTFERIEIHGNTRTRDKVIRRELRIYEGELYGASAIKTSKQRVTALGFFETVEVTTKKGSADDKMVAVVEVKEKSTGTFQVGAGFSSYENFILTGQISQNNFFGWGQTLSLQVQWSSVRQLGQIQFVEPHFFDTQWTFAFDIYATEALYTTFTRRAVGGSMTWGYELSGLAWLWPWTRSLEDMRLFATYTNEYVRVASAVATTLRHQFRSGTTSALRLSLQWDKRDNRLFPTKGIFVAFSHEMAPPLLAPDWLFGEKVNLFTRTTLEGRFYQPLWLGLVFRSRLAAGVIRAWDAEHPVPISELYYVGGINSVRGYRTYGLAPTEKIGTSPSGPLVDFVKGGNKQLVLNFEVEVPLLAQMGLRGVLFFDMGNTFPAGVWSDPKVPWSLYKSWGFGVRWQSPIGPLRFEWGFPLNRRRDSVTGLVIDQPSDFQFTIGNFF